MLNVEGVLPKSPRSPIAATGMQKIGHFLAVARVGDPGNSLNSDLGNRPLRPEPYSFIDYPLMVA